MQNNTESQKNTELKENMLRLRQEYAAAYARSVRNTRIWIIMRLVCAAAALVMVAAGIFKTTVVGSTVLGLVVALGISYMLRRGVRVLAWLGVAGGAAALALFLLNIGAYIQMAGSHPLLYLYILAALLDGGVQCAANGLLLADGEYRAFSQAVNDQTRV